MLLVPFLSPGGPSQWTNVVIIGSANCKAFGRAGASLVSGSEPSCLSACTDSASLVLLPITDSHSGGNSTPARAPDQATPRVVSLRWGCRPLQSCLPLEADVVLDPGFSHPFLPPCLRLCTVHFVSLTLWCIAVSALPNYLISIFMITSQ